MKNRKLLHIPGPTPVARSIQNQMARETVAFTDRDFVSYFKELILNLKTIGQTREETFVIAGSGTLAMEMAVANTLKFGARAMVISHGFFGDRFAEIMQRRGLQVDLLASPWGTAVPLGDIERKLNEHNYQAVTVTHVDTSTGVRAPVEEISQIVRQKPDTLLIVDGICATAAESESVEDMRIDVLFTGSQNAFGVSPGLFMLWVGSRAIERRESLVTIPDYYLDFQNWIPVMHDPSRYFATPAINLVWALGEAVCLILAEGLVARWQRHRHMTEAIHASLSALGLAILAEPTCRSHKITCVLYTEDLDDRFRLLLEEKGLMVAGGLGLYRGKAFRVGHMGNIDQHDLVALIATLEKALWKQEKISEIGVGVSALLKHLAAQDS